MNEFNLFTISDSATIKDALQKIDINKKKFVVVLKNNKVTGVITDGDIRRLILSGKKLENKIIFKNNFIFADFKDKFQVICELFNNNRIDFLPILKNGELFNIITKHQFHALLLEGINYSSNIDFFLFDHITIEHEVYNRPWGFYKSVWLSPHAQVKIITIFPESEISLQKHFHREEHWVVVKGDGNVICKEKNYNVIPGEYIHIPKKYKHKIINNSLVDNLILSEVQLGEYFGEDDIVRYSDKYGRH